MQAIAAEQGYTLNQNHAVGMVFLNQDEEKAASARSLLEQNLSAQGLEVLGWRIVPVDAENGCGDHALAILPQIEQIFVNAPTDMKSTPVRATSPTRSTVILPDASISVDGVCRRTR